MNNKTEINKGLIRYSKVTIVYHNFDPDSPSMVYVYEFEDVTIHYEDVTLHYFEKLWKYMVLTDKQGHETLLNVDNIHTINIIMWGIDDSQ